MSDPLAYFITFTTYGTWLHGRAPGSVDREHNMPGTPVLPPDSEREMACHEQMRQPEYVLDEARRRVVLQTILEVAKHRKWKVWAVSSFQSCACDRERGSKARESHDRFQGLGKPSAA